MTKIFAFDMDCTLTQQPCWTEEQCLIATPRIEVIEIVNNLYRKGHIIIIWTARREFLRTATEYWLKKNGVFYHAIDMHHKIGVDAYIDDRAINSQDSCELVKKIDELLATPDRWPEPEVD